MKKRILFLTQLFFASLVSLWSGLSKHAKYLSPALMLAAFCSVNSMAQVTVSGSTGADGTYSTVKGAFDAINANAQAATTISISLTAGTTETASAILNAGTWTSIAITPTTAVTITGSIASAIIKLNGADNVTIDGRIGGTGRNITISNSSITASTAAVWIAGTAVAGAGATGNTIRNCNIACGIAQNTSSSITIGVLIGGTSISTSSGTGAEDNDNNSVIANAITKCRFGIATRGASASNLNQNTIISDNLIGPSAFGTDEIGLNGILVQFENLCTVSKNTVQFVGGTLATTTAGGDRVGIGVGTGSWSSTSTTTQTGSNFTITGNIVHDIIEERTFSAVGILIGTTLSGPKTNNLIANNVIYNIRANSTAGDQCAGIGHAGGPGDKIVFNSISITGDLDPAGTTTASTSPIVGGICKHLAAAADTAVFIKDNSIYLDANTNTTSLLKAAIIGPAVGYAFGSGGLNNNDYWIPNFSNGNVTGVAGTGIVSFSTLANWQGAYTPVQDGASIQSDPLYNSATSNLKPFIGSPLVGAGVTVSGVPLDIEGSTRTSPPTIGAYENTTAPPPPDAGISNAVVGTAGQLYGAGQTFNIVATVKNFGFSSFSVCPVFYKVNGGSPVGPVNTAGPIAPNGTESVTFSGANAFTPATGGTYTIKAYSQLPTDAIATNDTFTVVVTVMDQIVTYPHVQKFTSPTNWTVLIQNAVGTTALWTLGLCTGPNGSSSDTAATSNCFNGSAGRKEVLRSPLFNLTALSHPVLHFYAAYRTFATENDSMQVLVSTDGGLTFFLATTVYNKSQNSTPSLATMPPSTMAYFPSSGMQWRYETVDLTNVAGLNNVVIGFRSCSQFGNRQWVDDVIVSNADNVCTSTVTAPGSYSCDADVNVNLITANVSASNLMVTRHDNQNPPFTLASPSIATNVTATSQNGTIYTPDAIASNKWWSVTYAGDDNTTYIASPEGHTTFNISIDISSIPSVNSPDSLYILERVDALGRWIALPTTRSGNILTASSITHYGDVAVGGTAYNFSNAAPTFTAGASATLTVCENSSNTSINSLLTVSDPDNGQTLTWSVVSGPSNGTANGFPTNASTTGGSVTPTGLSYSTSAYFGSDVLIVEVSDGSATAQITINITINSSTSSSTDVIACDSYTWNGVEHTTSGTYTTTGLTNAAGCDSSATVVLTINLSTSSSTDVTACDSYTWNGVEHTTSGTYTTSGLTNAAGCDSSATVVLTINNSTSSSTDVTACDSYTWNGVEHTTSGTYTTTGLTNAAGCDSSATVVLTINSSSSSSTDVTACDSYTWNGVEHSTSGTYTTTGLTNAAGCDSSATVVLIINYSTSSSTDVTACDSYTWNGVEHTTSGTYTTTGLTNAAGCDSSATVVLIINYSTSSSTDVTACDSYTWNGVEHTTSGTYTTTGLTNAAGCDSSATVVLTINLSTSSSTDVTACDSYTWNGVEHTTSGTYTTSGLTNAAGCDSSATVVLTINLSTSSSTDVTACDSYTWNGVEHNTSGTYTTTGLTNAAGCDSSATVVLTINLSTSSSTDVTACDSYTWNGVEHTTSGTYTTTGLTNAAGCDSSATVVLTINLSTSSSTDVTACDSYTWNGVEHNTSGTYTTTGLTNAAGCDSSATVVLTINYSSSSSTDVTACDSYTWNGVEHTTSGTYTTTGLTNAAGCDSSATVVLTINYSTSSSTDVTACDSYTWNGVEHTTSGTYTTTGLTNAAGCDSSATVVLTINLSTSSSTDVTACDSYTWNGVEHTTSGTYTTTGLTNAAGCDSSATVVLTINLSTSSSTDVTACDSYTWNGVEHTTSGTYTTTGLTNAAGCDSSATVVLTINSSSSSSTDVTACDSYTWNGVEHSTSGTYTTTGLTNAAGCDSSATVVLTINNSTSSSTDVTACDSYTWNGVEHTTSGTYTTTGLTNAAGCDSSATVVLTINSSSSSSTDVTACDSYTWNGVEHTTSGTYTTTGLTNAAGCDSSATVVLTINLSTSSSTDVTACDSYTWNGVEHTTSGTYTTTGLTNAAGCDSSATVVLTINLSTSSSTDVTACDSYTWNGVEHTTSGTYTTTGLTNAAGCDSSATVMLIINYSPVASVTPATVEVCKGIPVLLYEVGGAGVTFQWYSFVNPIPGATNSTYLTPANTQKKYKVLVTDLNGCSAFSNEVDIERLTTAKAIIEVLNPVNDPDLCINGQVRLRANGGSSLTYQWRFDGFDIAGATDRSYYATATGNYRVTVTITTTGCSDLSPAVTVFNSCSKAGEAMQQVAMNLYPNPTDGHFMLQLNLNDNQDGEAVVQIYNTLGQTVFDEMIPVTDGELRKEIWLHDNDPAGIYFVRTVINDNVFHGQVIYQK